MRRFCSEHGSISALNVTAHDGMLKCLFISCDVLMVGSVRPAQRRKGKMTLRVDIAVSPFIGYRYSTSSSHCTANLLSHRIP
jgi:hypothetical protein